MADMTQQQGPQRTLIRKLSDVMAIVDRVPKRGRNDNHGYDYATEADIATAVRSALAERHLLLVPDVLPEHTKVTEHVTKSGGVQRIASILVKFTLHDGDSGETLCYHIPGEGQDGGDKAFYKAVTGAEKYALLKIFLIPTGDDPEREPAGKSVQREAAHPPATSAPKPSGDVDLIRFGSCKGKRLSEISDKDLAWYADRAASDVAKNDEKWHKQNVARRDAILDEQERRKKVAPAPSSSPTSAFARAVAKLDAMGVPYKAYSEEFKKRGVLRGKDLTDEVAAEVIAFFAGSEPPPPGDEDAPPAGGAA